MTYQAVIIPTTGGMDRSIASSQPNLASLYTLVGLRQSRTHRGRIEQTPLFATDGTKTAGTYYAGGVQTEPNTANILAAIKMADRFYLSDYTIHYGGSAGTTQVKIYYQTPTVVGTGLNSGCFVDIQNGALLGINLGSSLDIVIDSATTFKWRKNGGAYTTNVPVSVSGVYIDTGNVIVYFLTTTGFTVGDTWLWTRTDFTQNETAVYSSTATIPTWISERRGYFRTASVYSAATQQPIGRIMQIVYDAAGIPYAISVGYMPVYGRTFTVFAKHLFVTCYETYGNTPSTTTLRRLAWSDLNDYNSFISTNVNEADSLVLDTNMETDSPTYGTIGELGAVRDVLFVYTSMGVFSSPYYGLPSVFNFQQSSPFRLNGSTVSGMPDSTMDSLVVTQTGHYIQRYDGLWFFDGSVYYWYGQAFPFMTFGAGTVIGSLCYDDRNQEVICYRYGIIDGVTDGYFIVFQERTKQYSTRWAGLGTTSPYIWSMWVWQGVFYAGVSDRRVCVEDIGDLLIPVYDRTNGTAFGTPTLITHFICGLPGVVSEVKDCFLTIRAKPGTASAYSVASFIKVVLAWASTDSGYIEDSTYVTDANAYWTTSRQTGLLDYPRIAFRYLSLKLTIIGTDGVKPPTGTAIAAIEPYVRNILTPPTNEPRR